MMHLPVVAPGATSAIPAGITKEIDNTETRFLVAFSGGKDSVAMVLHLLSLGVTKDRITLHHHDVDGDGQNLFDWPCTPSYCQAFADALELPILFSYRDGGIRREMFRKNEGLQDVLYQQTAGKKHTRLESRPGNSTRMKFPAVAADLRTRWCSAVVKIDVLSRVIANHPDYKTGRFVVCTGERREESAARSKYEELEPYRATSQSRQVQQWRPIINWSERQVWDIIAKNKIQPHPCYELGWSRCSCQLCIFSSPNNWASIAVIAPWKIVELHDIETEFGFTLYNNEGIVSRANRGIPFLKAENLERWQHEAMTDFSSPIFVDSWERPQGAFSGESSGSF